MAGAKRTDSPRLPLVLIALISVQVFCAAVFLGDLLADSRISAMTASERLDIYIETAAAFGLMAGIVFEVRYLLNLLQRKSHLEDSLRAANAAVYEVIEAEFDTWALTPAERDVATFLVKGLSISEIAALRGNAEGTVKAHLNAIYRKSGTRNRAEMLSHLIDVMMGRRAQSGEAVAASA